MLSSLPTPSRIVVEIDIKLDIRDNVYSSNLLHSIEYSFIIRFNEIDIPPQLGWLKT